MILKIDEIRIYPDTVTCEVLQTTSEGDHYLHHVQIARSAFEQFFSTLALQFLHSREKQAWGIVKEGLEEEESR